MTSVEIKISLRVITIVSKPQQYIHLNYWIFNKKEILTLET